MNRLNLLSLCRPLHRAAMFSLALTTVAATASVGVATPTPASGCVHLKALKRAFPKPTAVQFTAREPVSRGAIRSPVWPGTCGKWFTRYRRGLTEVDISLTLYGTHEQALVALAEPLYGTEEVLASGARVRYLGSNVSVDGTWRRFAGVASVYRNVFISSSSIAKTPITLRAQLALHRATHVRVRGLR